MSELVITLSAVVSITLLGIAADQVGVTIVFYIGALLGVAATAPIIIVANLKPRH